jgi:hypothetical protein
MAQSSFPTHQYSSSTFVESCGTVLFDLSKPYSKRVCLTSILASNGWVLAKGRRNINEARKDAALREITKRLDIDANCCLYAWLRELLIRTPQQTCKTGLVCVMG